MAKAEKWVEVEVRCPDGSRCFVARALSEAEQWMLRLVAERGNFADLRGGDAAIFAELLMFGIDNLEGFLTMDDDDDDDDDPGVAAA